MLYLYNELDIMLDQFVYCTISESTTTIDSYETELKQMLKGVDHVELAHAYIQQYSLTLRSEKDLKVLATASPPVWILLGRVRDEKKGVHGVFRVKLFSDFPSDEDRGHFMNWCQEEYRVWGNAEWDIDTSIAKKPEPYQWDDEKVIFLEDSEVLEDKNEVDGAKNYIENAGYSDDEEEAPSKKQKATADADEEEPSTPRSEEVGYVPYRSLTSSSSKVRNANWIVFSRFNTVNNRTTLRVYSHGVGLLWLVTQRCPSVTS
jgi:hypothetical protein